MFAQDLCYGQIKYIGTATIKMKKIERSDSTNNQ